MTRLLRCDIRCIADMDKHKTLATGLQVWDISTGQCRRTLRGHAGWVSSLSVLRGGRVVSASWDATLRVWNPETGDQTLILSSGHGNALYCLSCQPSSPYSPSPEASTLIALGCRQCEVQYWSLDTGTLLRSFLGHNKEVLFASFIRTLSVIDTI